MSNADHMKILIEGVESWNEWREINPEIIPNLNGAFLHKTDFNGVDLRFVNLNEADLSGCKLCGANLTRSSLNSANLARADLSRADLSGADLRFANLNGTDLSGANLSGVDLSNANIRFANLSKAHLGKADLSRADLSGANLIRANLIDSQLVGANFNSSILHLADFLRARVSHTHLAGLDLQKVKNLDEVIHLGPSTIGIDTIYKSEGEIPHKFLADAGVPSNFIENMAALTGKAIEYYSCFISYAEADNPISEKLFYSLQGETIRVWRLRERARGGEFIDAEINKAIRLHDKFVVICSHNSLNSEPVLYEIREALKREAEYKAVGSRRTVLFPITIDDYVFSWNHELADKLREKFIGDFRNWTDPDEFKKSFDKLVRDLNKRQDDTGTGDDASDV